MIPDLTFSGGSGGSAGGGNAVPLSFQSPTAINFGAGYISDPLSNEQTPTATTAPAGQLGGVSAPVETGASANYIPYILAGFGLIAAILIFKK